MSSANFTAQTALVETARTIGSETIGGTDEMPRPRTRKTLRPQSREDAELGARLKTVRKERGVSQGELAEQIGINQQTISLYEAGALRIPAKELLKIADALKVSLAEMTGKSRSAITSVQDKELRKMLSRVEQLPPRKRKQIAEYVEFVAKGAQG